jgi:hypothetical protein
VSIELTLLLLLLAPCSSDDGYVRDLKTFVARGLQITRCPTTQRLRVSTQDEQGLAAAGPAGAAARNSAAGIVPECCHDSDVDLEAFVAPPSFSFASSPSEVISSINNINLAESIAKHRSWAMPVGEKGAGEKAAAAAAVTAAVGAQSDTDGEDARAVC